MMKLNIPLPGREYDIMIDSGLLDRAGEHCRAVLPLAAKLAVVTDSNVAPLYAERVKKSLEGAGFAVQVTVIPAGETSKSMAMLERLYDEFMAFGLTRSDAVVALGGGVVGDLAGFAAASILRGVDFIQIPTTLLAQVDSSVGGKVAIDLKAGKNLAGAFWQPRGVLIDPDCLDTLPDRTFSDGMAEVIKYGCIQNAVFFEELEGFSSRQQAAAHMQHIIAVCCDIKRQMVEQDERDMGLRMLLNFGHTIGHAIEKCHGYEDYTHGEAVAIGMVEMTKRTERRGLTEPGTALRIESLCRQYGLPVRDEKADFTRIASAITMDKKNLGKTLKIVALEQLGKGVLVDTDPSFLEW